MFGYVTIDKPNMLIKDYTLYRSFYCGLCKAMGKYYGQVKRFLTNYDCTFMAIFYFAVYDADIIVKEETCILNPFKKKPIVKPSDMLRRICDITVLLADYKLKDDIDDDNSTSKKAARNLLKRAIKKAKSKEPEIACIIADKCKQLSTLEHEKCDIIDKLCDPFASMLDEIMTILLDKKHTPEMKNIFYNLGRWVYLMDAIDDLEKDVEKGRFNPLICVYGGYTNREEFVKTHKDDLTFMLMSAYNAIKENYDTIDFGRYESIVTHILWYGILNRSDLILKGDNKCQKTRFR